MVTKTVSALTSSMVDRLIRDLDSSDYAVRLQAVRSLGLATNTRTISVVRELVPLLRDDNPRIRLETFWTLEMIARRGFDSSELALHELNVLHKILEISDKVGPKGAAASDSVHEKFQEITCLFPDAENTDSSTFFGKYGRF